MKADHLLTLYDRVAEAPDAIARLRRFVLDLAVRGKLVDQNPEDDPASELLKRIAAEKARLWKADEIRKPRAVDPLNSDDLPFPLPVGWEWTQIAHLGGINPRNNAPDGHEASFVPMPLIAAEYGVSNEHESRPWGEIKKGYTHFAEGDVGLAKITPCFENRKSTVFRNLTGGFGSGTTELHVVRPLFVSADYIVVFLKCSHFVETGIPIMTGTAGQKRVPADYFTSSPFPLPPLAEQHRIVAKVDELMALCDRLEEARTSQEEVRDRLTKASLACLSAPDADAATFRSHARFAIHTLPALTVRADQVNHLRQTILDLAVHGKLVEQDPNDEPASSLLERITIAKTRLTRKARKTSAVANDPSSADQVPFNLPSSWAESTIGEICSKTGSGSTPRGGKNAYTPSGIVFLRSQNVQNNGLRLTDVAYIDQATHERMSGTTVKVSDLLLNITGGSIGRCCLVPDDLGQANISQHVSIIRTAIDGPQRFLHYVILSPYFQAFIFDEQTGAGRGGLPKYKMDRIPVALPPIAEQHRIVAKVDELMALCDQLEAGLSTARATCSHLLESVLHEALQGTHLTHS